jgi:DNA-damage-inducible protein D
MNQPQLWGMGSPFDTIRQYTPDGGEFWSARDLMPLLGYERWERFEDSIDRAVAAALNSGIVVADHFRSAAKVIKGGRWGEQTVGDFRLTRYACYLVAMNGDPRKPEIAAAQTYFAVRTREAETRPAAPREMSRLELIEFARESELGRLAETQRAQLAEARLVELAPKVDLAERYLSVPTGGRLLREVAKALGFTESTLRGVLVDRGVIFRRFADCGAPYWDAKAEHFKGDRPKFRVNETIVRHRGGVECPHYTLYALQPGVNLICRLTGRTQAPIDG